MTVLNTLQILATVLTIFASLVAVVGAVWGFYSGWLPRWVKRLNDRQAMEADIEAIRENTENLERQHEETMSQIQTLKHGQIAIAETVADEHNGVEVERLRKAHFGDRERPADFRRGEPYYGDD